MPKQKILLIPMISTITEDQARQIKAALAEDFPEHIIRVLSGAMTPVEFEVNHPEERTGGYA